MEIRTGNPTGVTSRVLAFNDADRLTRREPQVPANLLTLFREYFEVVPAQAPQLITESFRVRYQVYCREVKLSGFEDHNYPDGLECDEFDSQAEHLLLRHRPTGTLAGSVRVVMNLRHHAQQRFPIECIASKELPANCLESRGIARESVGEVSRFILTSRFRSRRGEWRWADGLTAVAVADPTASHDRRANLHPILGLIRAILMVSQKYNLRYWFAGMEPRLGRRLEQLGLFMDPITPIIEYFGPCRAYLTHVPTFLDKLLRTNPEAWALVTDGGKFACGEFNRHGIIVPPS